MRFNYVKEYFYKLSNTGYQLMMLPLILFILYYSQSVIKLPDLRLFSEEISRIIFFMMGSLSVTVLTGVQIIARRNANDIAKEVGLGIKLEKLEKVLTRKMVSHSILILLMPLFLLISKDNYFSIAFGVLSLWYFLQWPTPGRVCHLLKLKGDERKMVMTRGDAFI